LPQCPAPRPTKTPIDGQPFTCVGAPVDGAGTNIGTSANAFLGPTATAECRVPWCGSAYPAVSYILVSRSGKKQEFKTWAGKAANRARASYVDAAHQPHAGVGVSGRGIAGSYYDSGRQDFPGVAPLQRLGLQRARAVDIGVAGFRIDAAKHMWPDHIRAHSRPAGEQPELPRYFGTGKRPLRLSGGSSTWATLQNFGEQWGLIHQQMMMPLGFIDNLTTTSEVTEGGGAILTFPPVEDVQSGEQPSLWLIRTAS
uniref:Alpha-amylase n=1 Tax=Macrostomum lignano TaxID=282301 RepID=A0A1I8F848_9PLAT